MSGPSLPPMAEMDEEHEAWQEMCRRIKTLLGPITGNVNDDSWNPVIDQMRYWGEALHKLRLADPSHDEAAYIEYRRLAEESRP